MHKLIYNRGRTAQFWPTAQANNKLWKRIILHSLHAIYNRNHASTFIFILHRRLARLKFSWFWCVCFFLVQNGVLCLVLRYKLTSLTSHTHTQRNTSHHFFPIFVTSKPKTRNFFSWLVIVIRSIIILFCFVLFWQSFLPVFFVHQNFFPLLVPFFVYIHNTQYKCQAHFGIADAHSSIFSTPFPFFLTGSNFQIFFFFVQVKKIYKQKHTLWW